MNMRQAIEEALRINIQCQIENVYEAHEATPRVDFDSNTGIYTLRTLEFPGVNAKRYRPKLDTLGLRIESIVSNVADAFCYCVVDWKLVSDYAITFRLVEWGA